jgi:hypothetical protein
MQCISLNWLLYAAEVIPLFLLVFERKGFNPRADEINKTEVNWRCNVLLLTEFICSYSILHCFLKDFLLLWTGCWGLAQTSPCIRRFSDHLDVRASRRRIGHNFQLISLLIFCARLLAIAIPTPTWKWLRTDPVKYNLETVREREGEGEKIIIIC